MHSFASRAIGVLLVSAGVLAARDAAAFCRTGTCALPANFNPSATRCSPPTEDTCLFDKMSIRNVPLWWQPACVGFSVQRDAGKNATLVQFTAAVTAAFDAWSLASCAPSGQGSPVSISMRDLGPVACGDVGYHTDRPNQHVVVFRDKAWPHKASGDTSPSATIALTTVSFDPSTGEIYDADIELNSAEHEIALTPATGTNVYDLESVLTHEAGHFLGIAHSANKQAVMYFEDEGGSSKHRGLTPDDVSAICTVYPPDGRRPVDAQVDPSGVIAAGACDPVPRHGLSSACATAPQAVSAQGCAATPLRPSSAPGAPGFIFALALALRLRRPWSRQLHRVAGEHRGRSTRT